MTWRLGVDVGGTFTDVVLIAPTGEVRTRKVLSATGDYAAAVITGAREILADAGIAAADLAEVLHGTTVATNAILERRGAPTGLLTTEGFRDVLEIGRLRLARLYDLEFERPRPLVPRRWRLEIDERLDHTGGVRRPARRGVGPSRARPPAGRGRDLDRDLVPARLRRRRPRAASRRDRPRARARTPGDAVVGAAARGARVRADEHHGHERLRAPGDGAVPGPPGRPSSGRSGRRRRSWSCSPTAA